MSPKYCLESGSKSSSCVFLLEEDEEVFVPPKADTSVPEARGLSVPLFLSGFVIGFKYLVFCLRMDVLHDRYNLHTPLAYFLQ